MKKLLVTLLFGTFLAACGGDSCPSSSCDACSGDARTACEDAASMIEDADGFSDLSSEQQEATCAAAAIACVLGN